MLDYVPIIHFENEVSFALGPPSVQVLDLPPARSVIHSIIGKRVVEILSPFSCDALLSIFSSRHYTATHFTIPRRRHMDVTYKRPDWISDPISH